MSFGMSRDDFIKMMIGALEEQKKESIEHFEKPREATPEEIFRKMCFDYPDIHGEELQRLATNIDEFALAGSFPGYLRLTPKFIDNLIFLNGETCSGAESSKRSYRDEDIGSLCLSVFFSLPILLLRGNREMLSHVFDFEFIPFDTCGCPKLLSWTVIISRFVDYFVLIDSNIVASQGSKILCGYYMRSVCDAVSLLNPSSEGDSSASTLVEAIRRISEEYEVEKLAETREKALAEIHAGVTQRLGSAVIQEFKDSVKPNATDLDQKLMDSTEVGIKFDFEAIRQECLKSTLTNQSGEKTEEEQNFVGLSKRLWAHLSLVCRDVLLHVPEAASTYLPTLLDSVVYREEVDLYLASPYASSFAQRSYPEASECLYVMICSNLAASLKAQLLRNSGSPPLPTSQLQGLGLATGFCVGYLVHVLPYLGSLLQRMVSYADEGSDAGSRTSSGAQEALTFLCDVADFLLIASAGGGTRAGGNRVDVRLSGGGGVTTQRVHDQLTHHRIFQSLVNHLLLRLSGIDSPSSSSSTAVQNWGSDCSRVAGILSMACLQNSATATYITHKLCSGEYAAIVAASLELSDSNVDASPLGVAFQLPALPPRVPRGISLMLLIAMLSANSYCASSSFPAANVSANAGAGASVRMTLPSKKKGVAATAGLSQGSALSVATGARASLDTASAFGELSSIPASRLEVSGSQYVSINQELLERGVLLCVHRLAAEFDAEILRQGHLLHCISFQYFSRLNCSVLCYTPLCCYHNHF